MVRERREGDKKKIQTTSLYKVVVKSNAFPGILWTDEGMRSKKFSLCQNRERDLYLYFTSAAYFRGKANGFYPCQQDTFFNLIHTRKHYIHTPKHINTRVYIHVRARSINNGYAKRSGMGAKCVLPIEHSGDDNNMLRPKRVLCWN